MADVSVIIPARNAGRTIGDALGSVFTQTWRDVDVIVVDHGSSDGTAARVAEYGRRVRYVRATDPSQDQAIASGLALATGPFVTLLRASDVWMPRKLERQRLCFDRFPDSSLVTAEIELSHAPARRVLEIPDSVPLHGTPLALPGSGHLTEPRLSTVMIRQDVVDVALDAGEPGSIAERLLHAAQHHGVLRHLPLPLAITRSSEIEPGAEPPLPRMRNLLHDTAYRRLRASATSVLHRVDDLWSHRGGGRLRILVEAASPMSLAVVEPVLRQLRRDPRLELWFTSYAGSWDGRTIFAAAGIHDRVVAAADVRWQKFDAYINTDFWDMTWLPRRTKRVHFFHGVAGKYGLDAPVRIAPLVSTFDRLMFPNRDRLRRYAEAGIVDPDGPGAALVGYPKVDCLVDGSLDRRAIAEQLGLRPDRPTVLYAPTWSPYSSLNVMGRDLIPSLSALDVNVLIKLHDRSYDPGARGSGGVDWRSSLDELCREHGVVLANGADASPYLFCADLLITDHSSVGFEYMLLDRPIVTIDSPELVARARVTPQKVAQLQRASFVARHRRDVASLVRRALDRPLDHRHVRRAVADELFYCPGSATARAVQCLYDLLGLTAPEPVLRPHSATLQVMAAAGGI